MLQPCMCAHSVWFNPVSLVIERPKAGRRRPPFVGIKQSGQATFA